MRETEFLERVQKAGTLPSLKEAELWSFGVLGALTQLLSEAEVKRHFISQLPGEIKSRLFAEPAHALSMDRNAFIQHVASTLGVHAPEGERALRAVYRVLKDALSPGQISEFEAHIPKEIAAFLEREKLP